MLLIGAAALLTLAAGFLCYQYVAATEQFLRLVLAR